MARFNEDTQKCERRLRMLEDKVKQARTNPFMQSIENFRFDFEILRRNRCKAQLSQFEERHNKAISIFERKLANMAKEYLMSIEQLRTMPSRSEDLEGRRKDTESKATIIREKEIVREVVLIPCAYCGGLMPQTSTFCPNCGARRKG